ncbi:MAG: DUF3999 domain-containing protein [Methylotenera sp.]
MKNPRYIPGGLLIMLTLTATLAPAPVMAASFKLDANGNEPFYQSTLTKDIYQYTRSNALQDLTIYNAAGEQVPYALMPYEELHPQTTTHKDSKPLIIFPIHENALSNPNELRVQLEKNAGNTTLNISSNNGENTASGKANTVYLLDAGKKHEPLQTLSVDWQGSEGKLLTLEVLTSTDLQNWSHAGNAVLLKTATVNNSILQNSITLDNATGARYLQIRAANTSDAVFNLTKATAEYSDILAIAPKLLRQDIRFIERKEDNKTGHINLDFEALGRYPASHLHIQLPQDNTITNVTLLVRDNNSEPWIYLTTASVYRLRQHSKPFTSPDVVISPTIARYWRLQFNQSSGGIGAENPMLSLGWLPPTAVWNARGQAPFSLHVGENPNIVNTVDIASLIPDYKIEKIQQLANSAVTAEVSTNNITATQTISSWVSPIDYKRWLLWGGLFLGVMLLAGMAYTLLKTENKN